MVLKMSRIILGWETSNGKNFFTIEWKHPSFLQTKTILMQITQTASGKIITVTKSNKICNCWIRKNSKNFSMDTIMMKILTKKWTKKSKKLNNKQTDNNVKPAVLGLKRLLVRKPEQEMRVVWSLRVKEMILRVSFINTKKALIYYNNLQTWT